MTAADPEQRERVAEWYETRAAEVEADGRHGALASLWRTCAERVRVGEADQRLGRIERQQLDYDRDPA